MTAAPMARGNRSSPCRRHIARCADCASRRNFGHQSAILAGLLAARGNAVIVMDADGQHPPGLIPAFLERWREGFQVVQAIRADGPEPRIKSFFSRAVLSRAALAVRRRRPPVGRLPAAGRPVVDAVLQSAGHCSSCAASCRTSDTKPRSYRSPHHLACRPHELHVAEMVQLSVDGLMSFSIVPFAPRLPSAFQCRSRRSSTSSTSSSSG